MRGMISWLGLVGVLACAGAADPAASATKLPWEKESPVDHRGLIRALDDAAKARGQAIYTSFCVNCHGADGRTPQVPPAPAFGAGPLRGGADPYAMFLTLTHGNGLMVAQEWLSPAERYDVVHYIRETFVKPQQPALAALSADYLDRLPKHVPAAVNVDEPERDFGPAVASQFRTNAVSALSFRLGEGMAVSYDLHSLALNEAWQGGFLDLSQTGHTQLRGEGVPKPAGTPLQGLGTWFWGHDGTLDHPRENLLPRGPLPEKWFHHRGHYLHGDDVVLAYRIDGRDVLELPEKQPRFPALVHTLRLEPGDRPLVLCVGRYTAFEDNVAGVMPRDGLKFQRRNVSVPAAGVVALVGEDRDGALGEYVASAVLGDTDGLTWELGDAYRLTLRIPAGAKPRLLQVIRHSARGEAQLQSFASLTRHRETTQPLRDPEKLLRGGPARWPQVLTTRGETGPDDEPYTLDTLTLPGETPWGTWFRTSALDFLSDGRLVLTTYVGDVWLVSGIDRGLKELKWKRFAAGLYEPFGVKVVDDVIYVTCKDRLVRLHDFNADGEADFYESFHADDDVSLFFHAFNFDLHTDRAGNFYYVKCGQYTDYRLPGAVIKVSPDGRRREVVCTGFRTPNGMGILPDDRLTVSDNQGSWMPASKISIVRPGGFYGYSQTHVGGSRYGLRWAPDGGRIDHRKVEPPGTFDPPVIWMPQELDNSSGGQLWVDDPRWGPLSGRLLHTSFGKGWMYQLMIQDVGEVANGAIVKLPFDFRTGIQRARVNPKDGQVYATGLNGWNGGGRKELGEGGVQRVRYTGAPARLLTDVQVRPDGVELTFNFPLERESASQTRSYAIEQWNYRWQASYGSKHWSVRNPDEEGHDKVDVAAVTLSGDARSVRLRLPGLRPVHQMLIEVNLRGADGNKFAEEVLLTINRVPAR
jgi:mono/diheme cytochrome c family protein/glucose/arabinose dehydrogenase